MSAQIRVRVTPAMVVTMCRLRDEGVSYDKIGKAFGISRNTALNYVEEHLAKQRLGPAAPAAEPASVELPEPSERTAATVHGAHLEGYHRARRGFHVPAGKQDQYFALLKTGTPIAEAARRLGLSGGASS